MLGFLPDNPKWGSANPRQMIENLKGIIGQELPSLSFKATKNHEWKCN
tara:strand:- start:423 stop:566 length:144 start_codon:yes stop_codon:yes gene_type:complete